MEGELIASGTHKSLMATSPEYVQIEQSQQSTHELQPQ
jgi:ATP-binding cassette, subfamily B, bacterial